MNPAVVAAKIASLDPAKQELVVRLIDTLSASSQPTPPFDFPSAFTQWLDHLLAQHLSSRTLEYYTYAVQLFFAEFPDPTSAHVDAFISLLSPGAAHNHLSALRNFFSFCADRGLHPNIASHLRNPCHYNPRQPASQDTVDRLLSLPLNPRAFCILALLIDTGIRLHELCTIELSNIQGDRLTVIGKRLKTRTVPLTPFAQSAIDSQRATLPPGAKYLFHTRSGHHTHNRSVQRTIARLCKEAGVPHTSPHQFRHYWTTHLLQDGASLKAVSALLGHNQVSTTANIYWHICQPDVTQAALDHCPSKYLHRPRQLSFDDTQPKETVYGETAT